MNVCRHAWIPVGITGVFVLSLLLLAFQAAGASRLSETAEDIANGGGWYVAEGGSDSNACDTPLVPCASINGVFAQAGFIPGGLIFIMEGTYTGDGEAVALVDQDASLSGGWDETFSSQVGLSTLDGENARRGLVVAAGRTVDIARLTIENGSAQYGGGLYNQGTLTLSDCTIQHNHSTDNAGGVYNTGSLNMVDCQVLDNAAGDYGGGVYNENAASLKVISSNLDNNTATYGPGGLNNNGTATLISSTVSGNEWHGIYNHATLVMTDTVVTGNTGQGIINESGKSIVMKGALVTENTLTGIYSNGDLTIYDSTIRGNESGGLTLYHGTAALNNVTISGNTSGEYGAGIYNNSSMTVRSSTIAANHSTRNGGGIVNTGGLTLANSIVADNTSSSLGQDCYAYTYDNITSDGYNLVGDTNGCRFTTATGDLVNTASGLYPLFGTLGYHPLILSSPAINAGNPAGCTDHLGKILDTDMRGVARYGVCDMGAYEFHPDYNVLKTLFLSATFRNYCRDFFDGFDYPLSGWPTGENDAFRAEYLNSEFRLLVKPANSLVALKAPSCPRQDYLVETDARWVGTPGNSYGIAFGIVGAFETYYFFDVNTVLQQFRLMYKYPEGISTHVPQTYSAAIHPGTAANHLEVTLQGTKVTLYINGTELGTWTGLNTANPTEAGLIVSTSADFGSADARFDNFAMYNLPVPGAAGLHADGFGTGFTALSPESTPFIWQYLPEQVLFGWP